MDAVEQILEQWRAQRPDLDPSVMGVVGRISRAAQHAAQQQQETFRRHGLDAAGFDVLATLRRSAPPHRLTPVELSRTAMITTGGMTQRLHRLETDGLIERRPHPSDGRALLVGLTAKGRRLVDRVLPDHLATEHRLVAALTPRQQDQLARLLARMLQGLESPDAVAVASGP